MSLLSRRGFEHQFAFLVDTLDRGVRVFDEMVAELRLCGKRNWTDVAEMGVDRCVLQCDVHGQCICFPCEIITLSAISERSVSFLFHRIGALLFFYEKLKKMKNEK
jgi:hypothetical protein